ncbi:hypothetical protein [Oceanobacillus kimchii]|uniref:Uncharacterized protein n=1 Tax=Oceanobacillus kimchii TaxID=746691 RepID=A0ABQ5TI86_9BACI|nr:hypothetical protein [Oceanobacillus kimchii]GLO66170.1 hypothetical protein MACH08_19540 [Oceanobacillus kimchii]
MIARILFHQIEYWFEEDENKTITGIDEEYIKHMINDGYSSGQLVSYDSEDNEYYGWWQIKGYETQEGR